MNIVSLLIRQPRHILNMCGKKTNVYSNVNIELYTFITKYKLTIEHNNYLSYGMEFFFNKSNKTKIIKTKNTTQKTKRLGTRTPQKIESEPRYSRRVSCYYKTPIIYITRIYIRYKSSW